VSIASIARSLPVAAIAFLAAHCAFAQVQQATSAAPGELPLFAIEITVGSKWDQGKAPQEQQFFREHSSNLKRLRDAGSLVLGARYSDKGLLVLAAQDEEQARAMMDEDPSIKAEVFKYQIHPFSVFYGGTINARARRATP
jgi:uncharacterized protein YciI